MKNYTAAIKIIILAVVLAAGVSYISAWTGPTVAAPNGNAAAPINASSSPQTKTGPLVVNYSNIFSPGLEVLGPIQIVDGTQATGSVLVSNGAGVSHWAATSTIGLTSGSGSSNGSTLLGVVAVASTTVANNSSLTYTAAIPSGATYAFITFTGTASAASDGDQSVASGKIYVDLVGKTSRGAFVDTIDADPVAWYTGFSSSSAIAIPAHSANYGTVFPAYVWVGANGANLHATLPSHGAALFEFSK